MKHIKLIAVILGLIVIIVGGIFVSKEQGEEEVLIDDILKPDVELIDINAEHQFMDGKHIITGSIGLPTPCHVLTHDITFDRSIPGGAYIAFTASSQAESCAQVITDARFKVEFDADKDANIRALFNGEKANLILTPATSNLENFDVFMKG